MILNENPSSERCFMNYALIKHGSFIKRLNEIYRNTKVLLENEIFCRSRNTTNYTKLRFLSNNKKKIKFVKILKDDSSLENNINQTITNLPSKLSQNRYPLINFKPKKDYSEVKDLNQTRNSTSIPTLTVLKEYTTTSTVENLYQSRSIKRKEVYVDTSNEKKEINFSFNKNKTINKDLFLTTLKNREIDSPPNSVLKDYRINAKNAKTGFLLPSDKKGHSKPRPKVLGKKLDLIDISDYKFRRINNKKPFIYKESNRLKEFKKRLLSIEWGKNESGFN